VEEEELHQGGVGEVEYPLGVEEVPLLGGVGEVVFHQGVVVELLQVEGVVVVPHQGVGVGEVHLLVVLEVVVLLVLMTKDEYY
jgi:hypothetical protein